MNEITLVAAFLTGLLGSLHCIGMCGGIVGALSMQLPASVQQSKWRILPYLLAYNLGRLASYMLAGMLVGYLGMRFTALLPQPHLVGMVISGIFMIFLGLYLGGWWAALVHLEKLGAYLWRFLQPLSKPLFPVRHPWQALLLGGVWGWLPCGLVYTALALALASASVERGGLLMLAFGVGTLPMLLALGSTAYWLNQFTRKPLVRQVFGVLIILFGLYTLSGPVHYQHFGLQVPGMCTMPENF